MIDTILMDIVNEQSKEQDVAVLLSGGIDSISVAFAAHRLGKTLHCYTMYVDGVVSKDAQNAIDTAKEFNWDINIINVPTVNIVGDFKHLVSHYNCQKKTQLECTWPFLYVYPNIKEKELLTGWGADGWYGVSKRACMHYKEPKEKFDEFRNAYFAASNPVGVRQQEQLCDERGIKFIAPYFDDRVRNYMMQFDWYEMNKPFQKVKVVNAFPEFKRTKVRRHENLQLAAGVPDHFEKLLDNPEINLYNRKRVIDLVRDWQDKGESLF
jgi:asparagine synthetase B (glutamine-hydrolysing)